MKNKIIIILSLLLIILVLFGYIRYQNIRINKIDEINKVLGQRKRDISLALDSIKNEKHQLIDTLSKVLNHKITKEDKKQAILWIRSLE